MKKFYSITVLLFLVQSNLLAQNVSAGNDTTICQGSPLTLHASVDSAGAITQLNLPDDYYSPVVDLGFSFNYYGNTYTQCLLSTNVYIYFNIASAGGPSPWPITQAIPTTVASHPQNSIMGPWHDVDPGVAPYGIMSYATFGSAPNRYFVFNFCNVPMYSCNNILFTGQIILYEGTNIIETHISDKVVCASWNTGQAIHGLHNAAGTQATIVDGRNYPLVWATSNEGRRFTPDSSVTSYVVDTIPFTPVPMLGNLQWTDMAGNVLGIDQDLPVTPAQTTSYIVSMTDCGVGADTITVYVSQFDTTVTYFNPQCPNSFDGFIAASCTGTGPFTFVWKNSAGVILQTTVSFSGIDSLLNLGAGTYTLIVSDSTGCVKQHNYTLTTATYNANYTSSPSIVCKGSPVSFTNTSTGVPQSYQWTFGGGGTSTQEDPTHTFSVAGTFSVRLIVTYPGGCSDTVVKTIIVHELITGDFDWDPIIICEINPVNFSDQSNLNPVSWVWSFGDGSFGSGSNPQHQFSAGDYTVQMIVADSLCGIDTVSRNLTVFYQPNPDLGPDTSLCVGEYLTLNAGYPGNTYVWSNQSTASTITVTAASPTYYVISVNNNGCIGHDTIFVDLKCNVEIPTAFSPNSDGHNDIFRPRGNRVTGYDVKVFNRWGQMIFSNSFPTIEQGWNGKYKGEDCEMGVYVYEIDVTYVNGVNEQFQGNVTLIR